jgi:uncharacterized protein YjlB
MKENLLFSKGSVLRPKGVGKKGLSDSAQFTLANGYDEVSE